MLIIVSTIYGKLNENVFFILSFNIHFKKRINCLVYKN